MVATTPVVADFVRGAGGDKVAVTQILKPGVDPHEFEPSATDLQTIAGAALVVKSGVNLERWLDDTIKSAGSSGEVVDSSTGVAIRQGNGDEEQAQGDPHVWHDRRNAKILVRNIADALEARDPTPRASVAWTGRRLRGEAPPGRTGYRTVSSQSCTTGMSTRW